MDKLRYPIGRYAFIPDYSDVTISAWIDVIEAFPHDLNTLIGKMSESQLGEQYRPDGWTVRQVVHHVADSHINAYVRFKKVITEDTPTVQPYAQPDWAKLEDGLNADVQISLDLLLALHRRWVIFLRSLNPEDFERTYLHPEHGGENKLVYMLGLYAWHCRHHLAHVALVAGNV